MKLKYCIYSVFILLATCAFVTRTNEKSNQLRLDPQYAQILKVDFELNSIRDLICGRALRDVSLIPGRGEMSSLAVVPYIQAERELGRGWPSKAISMAGCSRLDNIRDLITAIVHNHIEGDFIETGTWRGGASIFARRVFDAFGQHSRRVYVADSFKGLPRATY